MVGASHFRRTLVPLAVATSTQTIFVPSYLPEILTSLTLIIGRSISHQNLPAFKDEGTHT